MNVLATQGLKAAHASALSWQEVVLHRLVGTYAALPQSTNTAAAELALGFPANSYFYLSRVDDLYGRVLMVWRASDPGGKDWLVSPFDTGGYRSTYMSLLPKLPAVHLAFVQTYTWPARTGFIEFKHWLQHVYVCAYEYVTGRPPLRPFMSALPLKKNTPPSWSFELRIPKRNLPDNVHLQLDAVFWQADDYEDFTDWICRTRPPHLHAPFFDFLERYSRVSPTLEESTRQAQFYVAGRT